MFTIELAPGSHDVACTYKNGSVFNYITVSVNALKSLKNALENNIPLTEYVLCEEDGAGPSLKISIKKDKIEFFAEQHIGRIINQFVFDVDTTEMKNALSVLPL